MKDKKIYLLCLFVFGILVTGCGDKAASPDTYTLNGTVYWGTKKAVGDSVEIIHWTHKDTTLNDARYMKIDTTFTNSNGQYSLKYTYSISWSDSVLYKVRAKDSINIWSSFQYIYIRRNSTVTVDFHL